LLGQRIKDGVIEGQWIGHANGLSLSHGFWLGVLQILSRFSQTTAKKSAPTDYWLPLALKTPLIQQTLVVGSKDRGWGHRGTMAGAYQWFVSCLIDLWIFLAWSLAILSKFSQTTAKKSAPEHWEGLSSIKH
jgi:hypothetical protein